MPLVSILSLSALGLFIGAGLGLAAKKFAVSRDAREIKAVEILPGANCGACGYPGCQAFALGLVSGESKVTGCPVGGGEVHSKLADIFGIEKEESAPIVAVIRCSGGAGASKDKYSYEGINRCSAAALLAGGHKQCPFGCLGFGDCERACPFGAIKIGADRLAHIDRSKCVACGLCVKACPKGLVCLIPLSQPVFAACLSRDKGKAVKAYCSAGCIGCGICVKLSPEGAVFLENNLPVIKSTSLNDLEKAVEKCPTKVLIKNP